MTLGVWNIMNVQVCDFRSNDFGTDFKNSVTNTGFAVVTNHGIDHGLIKANQQVWRQFFLQSLDYKNSFINATDGNQGYKGMKTEKAVGAKVADLKEFYHWRPFKTLPFGVAEIT